MKELFLYSLGVWIIFVITGMVNDYFKEKFLDRWLSEYSAHVVNTFAIISMVFLGTYLFINNMGADYSSRELLLIGLLWVGLSVFFELIFFRYVMNESWNDLLADYNIFKGRLWGFVLLTLLIAPSLIGKIIDA
jgi:hypothetical protein